MFDVVICRLCIVAIVAIVAMWCTAYYSYCGIGCHQEGKGRGMGRMERWRRGSKEGCSRRRSKVIIVIDTNSRKYLRGTKELIYVMS